MRPVACVALRVVACSLALGCASAPVQYDRDPEANFASYHSFAIVFPRAAESEDLPLPTEDVGQSQLVQRRVRQALMRALEAKGLEPLPEAEAELLVAFNVSSHRYPEVEDYGYGVSYGNSWPYDWWGDHWYRLSTRLRNEGLLVVDLIDAKTRRLVWRGWHREPLGASDVMQQEIPHVVGEVLSNYPPP
jgi:hypothetical protein